MLTDWEVGALRQTQHCPRNGKLVKLLHNATAFYVGRRSNEFLANESGYQPDRRCSKVLRRASPGDNTFVVYPPQLRLYLSSDGENVVFKKFVAPIAVASALLSTSAQAHFQLVYTSELLRERGGEITLKMPFTHPAASGHVMTVDQPEAFYQIRKGQKTDLLDKIKPIQWRSAENTGPAYEASVRLRGLGDNLFIMQPAPYLETSEDKYIQQFTKTIVNVGSLPTDWDADLGLAAEIVPLTKPYAIYEGGTFTGVVKADGKAVPYAEIEVEYVNYTPNLDTNAFAETATITPPAEAFITMTIFADANGTFTFGIPKAGQWGFAALDIGVKKEHKGKALSQDAVIWVQAHAVK